MADYGKTTWVDDDGSGTVGTAFSAARMNAIEDGLDDAAEHNKYGTLASRPAAAAANKNWLWMDSDTGELALSDGVAWRPLKTLKANLPSSIAYEDEANTFDGNQQTFNRAVAADKAISVQQAGTEKLYVQADGTLVWSSGSQLVPEAGVNALRIRDSLILGTAALTGGAVYTAEKLRLVAGSSDYIVSVTDGTGRVQHYWNASPSASPTYLAGGEAAGMILFSPPSNPFVRFRWASGSGKLAGDPITWEEKFAIGTDGVLTAYGSLNANNNTVTGLADATASGEALHYGQIGTAVAAASHTHTARGELPSEIAYEDEANTFTRRLRQVGQTDTYAVDLDAGSTGMILFRDSAAAIIGRIIGTTRANLRYRGGDGTAAAPALSFDGDPNTGIYSDAADVLKFTTGGVLRMQVSSAGLDMNSNKVIGVASGTASGDALHFGQIGAQIASQDDSRFPTADQKAAMPQNTSLFDGIGQVPSASNPYATYSDLWRKVATAVYWSTDEPLPAHTEDANGVLTASANGVLKVDGMTVVAGSLRILVKDEATASKNGIYAVTQPGSSTTPWILTPLHTHDTGTLAIGQLVPVRVGVRNAGTLWLQTSNLLSTATFVRIGGPAEDWKSPTLTNGWLNYGGVYATAKYRRDPDGTVHLKGLLKSGTIGAAAFTLPVGYRPAERHIFGSVTSPAASARVDVDTNGQVIPVNGSNAWISISGITFKAEQ